MSQRRLAAIMFSDIVGYDSLIKEDEKKAFEIRKINQRIHRRLIKRFNGLLLKEMESGTLASFNSNVDAVMCALSIQKANEEMNIPLRIGIHQGDVIFEKKDVLGDGVNIASRIQNAIETSGIVVSEKVHSDIKNKKGLEIKSLGTQSLKGVETPVGIYRVTCPDESVLDFTIDTGELVRPLSFKRSSIIMGIMIIALVSFVIYHFSLKSAAPTESKKRVLILPPENYLGIDSLNYVVAGMHDALIGDIGKIGALNIISRTTAVAWKKEGKSISEMASEYNIDYIVEPSVLCYDDSVCTQFKVFDGEENELSIQDFSVEKSQILSLYNKVAKDIANRINIILTPEQERLLAKSRTVDIEAYDAYLKGFQYIGDGGMESANKAREYLNIAIEKDPDWAPLYSHLAFLWVTLAQSGIESGENAYAKAKEYLNKALELDPDLANAHFVSGYIAYFQEWDWAKSEKELLKALAINPNDSWARSVYAHLLGLLKRPNEALVQAQLAIELDPSNTFIRIIYSSTLLLTGDCEAALATLERILAVDSTNASANGVLGMAAFRCGDFDKMIEISLRMSPIEDEIKTSIEKIYRDKGYTAASKILLEQEEKYWDPNISWPYGYALNCIRGNQQGEAMDYLEEAYEEHDPNMIFIATKLMPFDSLYNNPRFISLVKKMNLPLP